MSSQFISFLYYLYEFCIIEFLFMLLMLVLLFSHFLDFLSDFQDLWLIKNFQESLWFSRFFRIFRNFSTESEIFGDSQEFVFSGVSRILGILLDLFIQLNLELVRFSRFLPIFSRFWIPFLFLLLFSTKQSLLCRIRTSNTLFLTQYFPHLSLFHIHAHTHPWWAIIRIASLASP